MAKFTKPAFPDLPKAATQKPQALIDAPLKSEFRNRYRTEIPLSLRESTETEIKIAFGFNSGML